MRLGSKEVMVGTSKVGSSVVFETAEEHLARMVPIAGPEDRIGDIRRTLHGQRFEAAHAVAICVDERLVGLIEIEDLLAAPEDARASDVMDADPPVVSAGIDQERAAWHAIQRRESSLAVADEDGRFLGLVPPERMLAVLLWEHDEDMARLGGYLHDTAAARDASEERVVRRFWHRLPWLLVGLAGALLAAVLVGAFEDALRRNVVLAFFVPGIVYMADAVGTQTETLVIRGLSVGVPIRKVLKRELLTGFAIGVTLAVAFLPIAWWGWGDGRVAVAAAIAVFGACTTATLVAMSLPALLVRLGKDPAFGSGPLATVVQDLLSILVYFMLAALIVD